jgi:hypothetical protein
MDGEAVHHPLEGGFETASQTVRRRLSDGVIDQMVDVMGLP